MLSAALHLTIVFKAPNDPARNSSSGNFRSKCSTRQGKLLKAKPGALLFFDTDKFTKLGEKCGAAKTL